MRRSPVSKEADGWWLRSLGAQHEKDLQQWMCTGVSGRRWSKTSAAAPRRQAPPTALLRMPPSSSAAASTPPKPAARASTAAASAGGAAATPPRLLLLPIDGAGAGAGAGDGAGGRATVAQAATAKQTRYLAAALEAAAARSSATSPPPQGLLHLTLRARAAAAAAAPAAAAPPPPTAAASPAAWARLGTLCRGAGSAGQQQRLLLPRGAVYLPALGIGVAPATLRELTRAEALRRERAGVAGGAWRPERSGEVVCMGPAAAAAAKQEATAAAAAAAAVGVVTAAAAAAAVGVNGVEAAESGGAGAHNGFVGTGARVVFVAGSRRDIDWAGGSERGAAGRRALRATCLARRWPRSRPSSVGSTNSRASSNLSKTSSHLLNYSLLPGNVKRKQ